MRRPLAAIPVLLAVTALAGCGSSGSPEAPKNTAGMNPTENASTAAKFFAAVASNDPAKVKAAYDLAAPMSPALGYLELVHDGLARAGAADTVTTSGGRYQICRVAVPKTCHTFGAIVLADGKVNDFTIDGKKIRLR